jgi:hypothetical protein
MISMNFLNLSIYLKSYTCPFFRQNGGEGFYEEEDNLIPQLINIKCGLRMNNLLK